MEATPFWPTDCRSGRWFSWDGARYGGHRAHRDPADGFPGRGARLNPVSRAVWWPWRMTMSLFEAWSSTFDGVRVAADLTWPHEYRFTAPERTATVTAVRLGARAVDTAGNTSPLVEITVPLLPDQTPPRVVGFAPTANSTVESVSSVVARFNSLWIRGRSRRRLFT